VRRLFADDAVTELAAHDVTASSPGLTSRGATSVRDRVYRIERC
jgi:hypothetical protein